MHFPVRVDVLSADPSSRSSSRRAYPNILHLQRQQSKQVARREMSLFLGNPASGEQHLPKPVSAWQLRLHTHPRMKIVDVPAVVPTGHCTVLTALSFCRRVLTAFGTFIP